MVETGQNRIWTDDNIKFEILEETELNGIWIVRYENDKRGTHTEKVIISLSKVISP